MSKGKEMTTDDGDIPEDNQPFAAQFLDNVNISLNNSCNVYKTAKEANTINIIVNSRRYFNSLLWE